MKDNTPYRERPAAERERERRCMEAVLAGAPEVEGVWEAFGGIGLTAGVLRARFPQARLLACDLDAECVRAYNMAGHGLCILWDAQLMVRELPGGWVGKCGISLDFNKFTILDLWRDTRKATLVTEAVHLWRPRWLQLTDSAVRYLHLNWTRYGLDRPTLDRYVERLGAEVGRRFGYRVHSHAHHSAATYLLLVPK